MLNRRIHIRIHSITFDDEEAIGFKPKSNEKLTIEVSALSASIPESAKLKPKASSNPISVKNTSSFEIMKNKLQIAACFQPFSFRETSKAINSIPKIDKIEIVLKIKQMLKADRMLAKAIIMMNDIPENTCEKRSVKLFIPQFNRCDPRNTDTVAQSKSTDLKTRSGLPTKPANLQWDDHQFSRKRSYEKIEYYYDSFFNTETMKYEVGTIVLEIHNNNDRSLPFKPKAQPVINPASSTPLKLTAFSIPVNDEYSYDDKSNTHDDQTSNSNIAASSPDLTSNYDQPIEDVIILDQNENVQKVSRTHQAVDEKTGIKLSDLVGNPLPDRSKSCTEMFIFKDDI